MKGHFANIVIRPHWIQFLIDKAGYILSLPVLAAIVLFVENSYLRLAVLALMAGVTIVVAYYVMYIVRMTYVITDEQLLFIHGVFTNSTDYIELYRVVDYRQNRTFMQQLTGLKTITIFSGDPNTPEMNIIGVKEKVELVTEIRKRVEHNKQIKHIYEITNRF